MTAVRRNDEEPRKRVSKARVWIIYALAVPLALASLVALFNGSMTALVNIAAFGLVVLAARLTSKGIEDEAANKVLGARLASQGIDDKAAYISRRLARVPREPKKEGAAVAMATAAGLVAAFSAGQDLFLSLWSAAATFIGYLFVFALGPIKPKGEPSGPLGGHGFTAEEVIEAVEEARIKIAALETSARRIGVREFRARLGRICDIARRVVANIEEDPGDLRKARKFLNLYLNSAGQVTEKYAKTHEKTDDAELEHKFRTLLVNMENAFEDQYEKLLRDDKFDLDVEIEVLSDQLKREGIV